MSANGLKNDVYLYVNDAWTSVGHVLLFSTLDGVDMQSQSYLNDVKTSNESVNVTNDAMQTFVWVSDIGKWLDIDSNGNGAFGVALLNTIRNGSSVSIVAVRKLATDVPEPTTLAAVGLGLAGLGLARRRRK